MVYDLAAIVYDLPAIDSRLERRAMQSEADASESKDRDSGEERLARLYQIPTPKQTDNS